MAYSEYKTNGQGNLAWGDSFDASKKVPVIAKRIWSTLDNATQWVKDDNSSAIAGLIITVVNDSDSSKNGTYFVKSIGSAGTLVKLSDNISTTYQKVNYPSEFTNEQTSVKSVVSGDSIESAIHKIEVAISALASEMIKKEEATAQAYTQIVEALKNKGIM